jgi:chromosome partitioning protein
VTDRGAPAATTPDPSASEHDSRSQPAPRRRTNGGATSASTDPAARTARIMAVANQKGGVGKSTTAVSLGAALAEAGHVVLVIDLDPQGNASTGLGIRHEAREVTVYDVLASDADIRGAIVQTPLENLFAVPSTIDLAGAEIELVSQFSRELRLRRALDPLRRGVFDFILLDCPPSLSLLTINALAAAEELIVPIQCEYYALEGLGQLLRNVRLVQQNVNPGLRLSGIVMTMFDPRTKLSEQVVEEVRKYFGDLVYRTVIPRTVRLSEAPGFGLPITVYDPRSRGAECYRDLAGEVAAREASEGPMPVFDEMPNVVVEPVAPPPPVARSAPRPLRDPATEEREPEADDSEEELEVGPEEELERPVVETPSRAGSGDHQPIHGDRAASAKAIGTMSEPESELEPEAIARVDAPTMADSPAEPEVAAEPTVEVRDDRSASAHAPPSTSRSPVEARPEGEEREVVVIDAYDLDPDAQSHPQVEGDGIADDDVDDGERKRWSLFRRGGKR